MKSESTKTLSIDDALSMCSKYPNNFSRVIKHRYRNFWETHVSDLFGKTESEKLYRYFFPESGKCEICGSSDCHYRSFTVGYWLTCSHKCALVKVSRLKYGTDNPFQSDNVKLKMKSTNLARYGFEYPNKNSRQIARAKITKLKRYGSENYNNIEKRTRTCLTRYGVTNPNKLQRIKNKISNTCIDRYGIPRFTNRKKSDETCMLRYGGTSVMQSAEIFSKQQRNAYQTKKYIFPSGRLVDVQGYEPWALDKLVLDGISEYDIILDKKIQPKIFYLYNEKRCRYYPDIYIRSQNKIIEVKSDWTYKLHEKRNLEKKCACENLGIEFEFWIFDKKQKLTIS